MERKTILKLKNNSEFKKVSDLVNFYQKKLPLNYFYKPVGIELEITHDCNLKCQGCPIIWDQKKIKDILISQDYIDILKDCSKQSIFAYSLTGGETFLKFDVVKKIIASNHGLDLFKLNTNGSFFKSSKLAKKYFLELKTAGFVSQNKFIKPVLVISMGQQNFAGVPIKNSIYAVTEFFKVFNSDAVISLNIVDRNLDLSQKIYHDFIKLFSKENKSLPIDNLEVRIFSLNNYPTLNRLKISSDIKISISSLIKKYQQDYLSKGCFNISSKNNYFDNCAETLVPRCLLCPDGKLYSCPGFNLTHCLGDLNSSSINNIIQKTNQNLILKEIFTKNLASLYKLALKNDKTLDKLKLSESYDPCDLCQFLSHNLKKNETN
jgi:hypothetical protein